MTARTAAPIWKEGLAIVPLVVAWLVMRYVATSGFGRDCYLHEGVAWTLMLVGFPCFVMSLVGVGLLIFSLPAPTVSRTIIRLVLVVTVPAVYVLPFAVADIALNLEAMVCGAR
jgi:hypothetical protein